jgi:hypothetical protein
MDVVINTMEFQNFLLFNDTAAFKYEGKAMDNSRSYIGPGFHPLRTLFFYWTKSQHRKKVIQILKTTGGIPTDAISQIFQGENLWLFFIKRLTIYDRQKYNQFRRLFHPLPTEVLLSRDAAGNHSLLISVENQIPGVVGYIANEWPYTSPLLYWTHNNKLPIVLAKEKFTHALSTIPFRETKTDYRKEGDDDLCLVIHDHPKYKVVLNAKYIYNVLMEMHKKTLELEAQVMHLICNVSFFAGNKPINELLIDYALPSLKYNFDS